MSNFKRPCKRFLSDEDEQNKLLCDIYWREVRSEQQRLEKQYEVYKKCPEKHKSYRKFLEYFVKNHKNSGERWKDYWNRKLDQWLEEDFKERKSSLWQKLKEEFSKKNRTEETVKDQDEEQQENVQMKEECSRYKEGGSCCKKREAVIKIMQSVEIQTEGAESVGVQTDEVKSIETQTENLKSVEVQTDEM